MFAPFDRAPAVRLPFARPVVDEATEADLDALVALAVARGGGDPATRRAAFARTLAEAAADRVSGPVVRVARVDRRVAGYGLARRLVPPEGPFVPAGWYLTGLVVDPPARRRGVGAALVDRRLATLFERTPTVRAFVAAVNLASVALLTSRGFRLEAEDARVPEVTFTGGRGLLLRRDAPL